MRQEGPDTRLGRERPRPTAPASDGLGQHVQRSHCHQAAAYGAPPGDAVPQAGQQHEQHRDGRAVSRTGQRRSIQQSPASRAAVQRPEQARVD